ncbi:MAG: rRNA maturation RNase YbeY, partial [Planctomycetota bacterium]
EYDLAITSECDRVPYPDRLLRTAISTTLSRHGVPAAQISVALVDDKRITQLNELHLGRDDPTDVLSFDLSNRGDADNSKTAGDGAPVEGEIVVSLDTAAREARQRGHRVDAELTLYVVHGILHLLGYDDRSRTDADRMHKMEDVILGSVGLGPVYRGPTG